MLKIEWGYPMKENNSLHDMLKTEQNIVDDLLAFYNSEHDFNRIIYTEWTAKDVLAHIVMWHESFANNIVDIVNGNKLNLLKGLLHDLNENGVKEYKKYSMEELKEKLLNAQEKINNNIGNGKIKIIPYRKKSKREYTKEEHLEIVYKHIQKHYGDIIKKSKDVY